MPSPCDRSERGATLQEVLIVIAIIATVSAIAGATVFRPNDRLDVNQAVASLRNEAATLRARAMINSEKISWLPRHSSLIHLDNCEGDAPSLTFTAQGAALGDPICLEKGGISAQLTPDWLTGSLKRTPQ